MTLREIDKTLYKQKQRKLALCLCVIFFILAMVFSTMLRTYFGNPEGSNTWVNLTGVLIGLALTAGLFTLVSGHASLDEIRYAWRLKRQTLKIQNKLHHWEANLAQGDQTAATVIAFYFQGVLQLQKLEGNDFGYSETRAREARFRNQCRELGLRANPEEFEQDLLVTLNA
ncbi:DUF3087 family protein [Pontibacter sp. JAM-7]|uniref:DUF3087 family protein n=1 Tax=Pontibacter sp. JAM-7 TaxID=3366581 RepID=UPI003AF7DAAE